jgi:uncharacterized membrane protein YhaH (DUF805 family)
MTEQTLNQYAAPRAHVADVGEAGATGELNLFSAKGRIGRLRYLAHVMGASLVYGLVIGIALPVSAGSTLVYGGITAIAVVAFLWFSFIAGIKRCHDMDISGWWSITAIIPLIGLAWIFVPGSKGANRFGAPPPPHGWGVRILAFMMPLFAILGIVAAIALPAYQSYVTKARAAQAAQQVQPAQQP